MILSFAHHQYDSSVQIPIFILSSCLYSVRDWSLIMVRGGGGSYKTGRGHVKFYPYERGGGSFSYAEGRGRGTKSFGVVFMW